MEKGKKPTVIVLALEIAAIVILHAIKINQSEKPPTNKEVSRNTTTIQADASTRSNFQTRSNYSLAALKY